MRERLKTRGRCPSRTRTGLSYAPAISFAWLKSRPSLRLPRKSRTSFLSTPQRSETM